MQHANQNGTRPLISRLFLAVLGYFAIIFTAAAIAPRLPLELSQDYSTRILVVVLFAGLLAICLMLFREVRDFVRDQWVLARRHGRWLAFAGLAGMLYFAIAFVAAGLDPGRMQGWHFNLHFVLSSLLLSSLLNPLVEEFFFRAVAIGRSSGTSAWVSAVLSGLVFAAIHPDRPLSVFVFSLVAAGLYLRAGLLGAYTFHAAYNLTNCAVLLIASNAR